MKKQTIIKDNLQLAILKRLNSIGIDSETDQVDYTILQFIINYISKIVDRDQFQFGKFDLVLTKNNLLVSFIESDMEVNVHVEHNNETRMQEIHISNNRYPEYNSVISSEEFVVRYHVGTNDESEQFSYDTLNGKYEYILWKDSKMDFNGILEPISAVIGNREYFDYKILLCEGGKIKSTSKAISIYRENKEEELADNIMKVFDDLKNEKDRLIAKKTKTRKRIIKKN